MIDGRGFGHGVGLAQDGALSMGRAGAGTAQILGQFYPGTSLTRTGGQVRVQVLAAGGGDTTVTFPAGGEVLDAETGQQSAGFPMRVPAGAQVDLRWANGRYTATVLGGVRAQAVSTAVTLPPLPTPPSPTTTTTAPGGSGGPLPGSPGGPPAPGAPGAPAGSSTTTTRPATTTTAPPSSASSTRPLWAVPADNSVTGVVATGRSYRGVVEALANGSALELVNQLDVETYLRGMGEVQNPSWPLTSLQSQVIVERTYALRAMAAAGEICDDTRCQVYLGQGGEYPAQDRAVATTTGYVLAYGGSLAATVFSANGGGFEASPEEGFGSSDAGYPYLRAAAYYTSDPDPWNVTISLGDVAARMGYPGTLTSAAVTASGPSGRALTVTLQGTAGPVVTSGIGFAAAMGLRSNLFRMTDTEVATAPPPPPPAQAVQALPTDVSALRASVSAAQPVNGDRSPTHVVARTGPPGGNPLWWAGVAALVVLAAGAGYLIRRRKRGSV